jgi:NOL1/NOP2/fmu family ribosome biogenesis protein
MEEVAPWVEPSDGQYYFIHQNIIRMFPAGKRMEVLLALHYLKVLAIGTPIAAIMKNKLVPEHGLALSVKLNKENVTRIPVTREQALDYLMKNQLDLSGAPLGFALIEYEGTGLGWVNVIQNRFNNLYPSSWRIRMENHR